MTIYLFSIMPEGFKELTLPDGETLLQHNCLRWTGDSKMSTWTKPELTWLKDDLSGDNDQDADFLKFHGATVCSKHAVDILTPIISGLVEFLPVYIGGEERFILNVVNVLDIMDKGKSTYKIYSDGKVGMCEHAFLNEPDDQQYIYKVAGFMGRTFVNEKFNRIIIDNNISGSLVREYKNP